MLNVASSFTEKLYWTLNNNKKAPCHEEARMSNAWASTIISLTGALGKGEPIWLCIFKPYYGVAIRFSKAGALCFSSNSGLVFGGV